MLCTMPSSSELRTKLMRAARGFLDARPYDGMAFMNLEADETANLLFELCSSQC